MSKEQIKDKIREIFSELGYDIEKDNMEYMDSIKFIQLIISIEENFMIEIPEQYLNYTIMNLSILTELIQTIITDS